MKVLRLLIVEDEFIVGFELSQVLESMGHEVCGVVSSGEQALASVSADRPDCVLMDVNIRGSIDGAKVAAAIRRDFGAEVVFVTGLPARAMAEEVQALQPAAVLGKPIDHDELAAVLDGIASGRRRLPTAVGPCAGDRGHGDSP